MNYQSTLRFLLLFKTRNWNSPLRRTRNANHRSEADFKAVHGENRLSASFAVETNSRLRSRWKQTLGFVRGGKSRAYGVYPSKRGTVLDRRMAYVKERGSVKLLLINRYAERLVTHDGPVLPT